LLLVSHAVKLSTSLLRASEIPDLNINFFPRHLQERMTIQRVDKLQISDLKRSQLRTKFAMSSRPTKNSVPVPKPLLNH